ncbi:MAG: endonuclease V [Pirellulales bacterium]
MTRYNQRMVFDFVALPDLPAQLHGLLWQIPAGHVATYGDVAEALGNRVAAKWIGHEMLHHAHHTDCHCHRVVRANGDVGAYISGQPADKISRLQGEGVAVERGRVDLSRYRFRDFRGDRPLERLRQIQESLRGQIDPTYAGVGLPNLIGGLDVSYAAPRAAVAAYTLFDTATGQLVWSQTLHAEVHFPYITSYLTFRELPVYLALLEQVRAAGQLAPVVLVDGTGILHPRRMGIASHLGIVADMATVGVTKTLLCGTVAAGPQRSNQAGRSAKARPSTRPILLDGEALAVAVYPTPKARNPLYVSPGHRTDCALAQSVVEHFLAGHRLPEPLHWADRLSRAAVQQRAADGGASRAIIHPPYKGPDDC